MPRHPCPRAGVEENSRHLRSSSIMASRSVSFQLGQEFVVIPSTVPRFLCTVLQSQPIRRGVFIRGNFTPDVLYDSRWDLTLTSTCL